MAICAWPQNDRIVQSPTIAHNQLELENITQSIEDLPKKTTIESDQAATRKSSNMFQNKELIWVPNKIYIDSTSISRELINFVKDNTQAECSFGNPFASKMKHLKTLRKGVSWSSVHSVPRTTRWAFKA